MLAESDRAFLCRVPIFAGLSPRAIARVCELARRVDIHESSEIFAEGELASEMFVVLEGKLEVRKRSTAGADAVIARLHPGDVGGEMSLIDIQPRSAGVHALGPAALVVVTYADLATLYKEDSESYVLLVLNIAREISRRLRRLDGLLADVIANVQEILVGREKGGLGT